MKFPVKLNQDTCVTQELFNANWKSLSLHISNRFKHDSDFLAFIMFQFINKPEAIIFRVP